MQIVEEYSILANKLELASPGPLQTLQGHSNYLLPASQTPQISQENRGKTEGKNLVGNSLEIPFLGQKGPPPLLSGSTFFATMLYRFLGGVGVWGFGVWGVGNTTLGDSPVYKQFPENTKTARFSSPEELQRREK